MKYLKKLIGFIVVLSMFTTTFGVSETFASNQLKKGTVRIVLGDREISNCIDEVVYNNVRYIPAFFYIFATYKQLSIPSLKLSKVNYNQSNGSNTYEFDPYGYVSFFAGSTKYVDEYYEYNLKYHPAIMYDYIVYVSAEDVAWAFGGTYGFDASKNTIYIY